MLEAVDLFQLSDPHRAARAFQELIRRGAPLLPLTRKLPEAEFEDAGHAGRATAGLDAPIQLCKIPSRPEAALELIRAAAGAADDQPFAENDRPGGQRCQQQDPQDDLDRHARLQDEADDRQLLTHSLWLLQRETPAAVSAAG